MERGETARQTFRTRHGSVLAAVIGLLISLIAVSPARAQLTASPHAVYRTALDHIFVFAITSDGRLVDKLWNGQQWVWEDQGAPPGTSLQNFPPSAPSAVYQTKQDRVVVFATGRDGHLHAKIVDGQQCWLWEDAGSPPNAHPWQYGPPAAAYQPSLDRVSAFVTGDDGHLYSVFWDASQQKWVWTDHGIPSDIPSSAPGVFVATSPSVAHDASIDLVNAFVVGTDGKLDRNFWDQQGQRSVWSVEGIPSTGFNVTSPILLIPHPSAAYETSQKSTFVFVITQDGHVWDKSTVWEDEGTPPGTIVNYPSPHAINVPSLKSVIVFVNGQDGQLHAKPVDPLNLYQQPAWYNPEPGPPPGTFVTATSSPHAVHQTSIDRVIAFVIGRGGNLYSVFFDDTQQKWAWTDLGNPPAPGLPIPSAVCRSLAGPPPVVGAGSPTDTGCPVGQHCCGQVTAAGCSVACVPFATLCQPLCPAGFGCCGSASSDGSCSGNCVRFLAACRTPVKPRL